MGESVNKKIYELMPDEVLALFDTKKSGLSQKEAMARLEKFGPNVISDVKKKSRVKIFLDNFRSPLIYTLLTASVVTLVMGKLDESIVILTITFINAIIGYYQEEKADNALEALRKLTTLQSVIMRDGKHREVRSDVLVPGDIIILEEGDKIPADGRLVEASSLLINEAVLTGESLPVKKNEAPFIQEEEAEEPTNMLYMGTTVLGGRGRMVVTGTGKATEFGKISEIVADEMDLATPLQKKLAKFNKKLGVAVLLICGLIFIVGVLDGREPLVMIELAISMAVSAIPEGLPVAITVILVLGVKRMAKHRAIIRNLTAVETLGTTTVIASDKTGTITHNKLTATKIFTDKVYRISGEGFGIKGEIYDDQLRVEPDENIKQLLRIGAITNNGKMEIKNNRSAVYGDPTDCAILVAAYKIGINLRSLSRYVNKIAEIPFSSELKYHAVLAESSGAKAIYLKGAPETVLSLCRYCYKGEAAPQKINSEFKEQVEKQIKYFASRGLRIIALAFREERLGKIGLSSGDIDMGGFVFVGLLGMRDTYRSGIREAIHTCKKAGIRMVMITGDHIDTARAIGQDIGIIEKASEAIEATDLEQMGIKKAKKLIEKVNVFARISPLSKYKIIEALKSNGEIVAMTGDGVNDVPALKKADIGVAMGVMGTEAAKDASDMVLTNDNFSTIVHAVSEGRAVFSNIRKTVFYLLSTNLGEVVTVFTGLILGYPLVLLPLQILWINLVTDSCTAIPLGMEPPHSNQINRPPRDPKEPIISKRMLLKIIMTALVMGFGAITVFNYALPGGLDYARTVTFTYLVVIQWFNVINARSETSSIFTLNPFTNKPLIIGLLVAITLQLVALYSGLLGEALKITPLAIRDWYLIIPLAAVIIVFSELEKLIYRVSHQKNDNSTK